jgi:hypothetical protein
MIVLSAAAVMILQQVPSIASTLGGGVAVSTLGSFKSAANALGYGSKGAAGLGYRGIKSGYDRYMGSRKNSITEK